MKVSIQRTSATEVDIAGFHSVTQSVTVVARSPRRNARPVRRTRTPLHRQQVSTDGLVEITLVRSSRNRLGGGARARPALAK
jgi:hypothetical protein